MLEIDGQLSQRWRQRGCHMCDPCLDLTKLGQFQPVEESPKCTGLQLAGELHHNGHPGWPASPYMMFRMPGKICQSLLLQ